MSEACLFVDALGLKGCWIESDNAAAKEACLFVKALLMDCWIESHIASVISFSVSELVPPWEFCSHLVLY